jgi:hypothetical protein
LLAASEFARTGVAGAATTDVAARLLEALARTPLARVADGFFAFVIDTVARLG